MPRSFTFTTISDYLAAKATSGTGNVIYAALVSSGIKSGSVVSKITATGDVFIDSINPFVTPDLGQEGDTLYYSATEGYRFLRAGNSAWDATSYGQVFIDLSKIPSGFAVVAPFTDVFTYKKTTEDIGSGKSSMTKLLGKSLVWNQGCHILGSTSGSGITLVSNNAGSYIVTGKATKNFNSLTLTRYTTLITGHKYLIKGCPAGGSNSTYRLRFTSGSVSELGNGIIIRGDGVISNLTISILSGYEISGSLVFRPVCIDLTLMFGAGNEPSTVAEFEALFNKSYYDYNAGQIINNNVEAYETVGFNQWDEEWEVGAYNINDGTPRNPEPGTSAIRSKANNPIRVFPNTTYYAKYGGASDSSRIIVFFYDAQMNFISRLSGAASTNKTWTTPANCQYVRFYVETATYNHDICINLSGPRNGQYEPYKKTTLQVPITALRGKLNGQGNSVNIFPDGLKSAGNVYDEIGNGYAIKRVGTVDLGTLDWTYNSDSAYMYAPIANIANPGEPRLVPLICAKYVGIYDGRTFADAPDKSIFNRSAPNLGVIVKDSAYTDAAAFKAAMSGVMLNYLLATPEYYVLDRDFNWKYRVSEYHTKKALPENGEEPTTAPFACEIKQI